MSSSASQQPQQEVVLLMEQVSGPRRPASERKRKKRAQAVREHFISANLIIADVSPTPRLSPESSSGPMWPATSFVSLSRVPLGARQSLNGESVCRWLLEGHWRRFRDAGGWRNVQRPFFSSFPFFFFFLFFSPSADVSRAAGSRFSSGRLRAGATRFWWSG